MPLEEARRMGRGPRMEPLLYDTLRQKIHTLAGEAVRVRLGPEISPQRMKRYILRIARDLNVPVTVRRVPGGVIFWRSSEEWSVRESPPRIWTCNVAKFGERRALRGRHIGYQHSHNAFDVRAE
jgi:hypothetical protein